MTDTPTPGAGAETDAEILFPERTVRVDGRDVTVHELTFGQSLRVTAQLAPVLDALAPDYAPGGPGVTVEKIVTALAAHPDVALALLTATTGQDAAWLADLPEAGGYLLLLTCVAVHIPFFVTRLALRFPPTPAATVSSTPSPGSSATGTPGLH